MNKIIKTIGGTFCLVFLKQIGEPCELEFLELLKQEDENAFKVYGKENYDIYSPKFNLKYEVKNQNNAFKYVVTELEINDFPSGFTITEADYWVIKCKNNLHLIDYRVLRDLIFGKRNYTHQIKGNKVVLNLISIQELKDNSLRIYTQLNNGGKQWKP